MKTRLPIVTARGPLLCGDCGDCDYIAFAWHEDRCGHPEGGPDEVWFDKPPPKGCRGWRLLDTSPEKTT